MELEKRRKRQTTKFAIKNKLFGKWFNPVIASTELWEDKESDEYCTLTSNGWVTVRSKRQPEFRDMIPLNLISEETMRKLAYSMGETDESIAARENQK